MLLTFRVGVCAVVVSFSEGIKTCLGHAARNISHSNRSDLGMIQCFL
uniref:Uncharacterized protein n=1 Tax=Arundo donax TaxID=35708 RepID=A0A0A8XQU9_ARUDO